MTLSLKRRSLSKPKRGSRVQVYDLGAVRARNKNKAHSYLLDLFKESGLSKAEVAKMVGKKPEQITRWLAGPGNLTLDTLSDLIFVMKGQTFTLQAKGDLAQNKSSRPHPNWLKTIVSTEWKEVSSEVGGGEIKSASIPYVTTISSSKERPHEYFRAGSEKEIYEVA